ncbi:MAG TPA: hypothetical protein VHC97_11365 [Thermoanaerobaculia bacterium]|jgi:hypothetical protein|nr:hypothetical protein [Thermoanaerobaculia bacterium]
MRKVLVSFGLLLCLAVVAVAATKALPPEYPAQVDAVAEDQSSLQVTQISREIPAEKWKSVTLTADPKVKTEMKGLHPKDLVQVAESGGTMQDVEIQKVSVAFLRIFFTMIVTAALLWIIAWLAIRGTGYGLARFLVGRDNRYSKSKFQIAIWFGTVITAYLATLALRWWASVPSLVGGVDIPQNLLLLSGISALSFGTAKGITQGKENRAEAAGVPAKPVADHPRFPSDLVSDDSGQPDLGDFQMVVITLIAVGVYVVQMFDFLSLLHLSAQVSLPDVDPTLLGIFGISHGAYITKKAVSGDDGQPAGGQNAEAAAAKAAAAAVNNPPAGQPGPV